jgi:hypothetical protein
MLKFSAQSEHILPLGLKGLIVFGVFYKYSSAAPQRTAYSKVPSQMAANLKTGSPL